MLGHPTLIKFNRKYNALLQHYHNGHCTIQEVLEEIEVLEKFNFYKEDK